MDVDLDPDQGLDHADDHQRDIRPPFPEALAQQGNDPRRYEGQGDETEYVIPVRDVGPTDRSRREKMAQESSDKQYYSQPHQPCVTVTLHPSSDRDIQAVRDAVGHVSTAAVSVPDKVPGADAIGDSIEPD